MHSLVLYTTSKPLHAKNPPKYKEDSIFKFFTHCQMSRQGNDPNSSIALLQERFRQLEKVKERREGKQLLKLLSSETTSSSSSSSSMHSHTSQNYSQQPRLVTPHRPTLHDSLSLGLNLSNKQGDHSTMKMKPPSSSSNLWPQGASTSRNFDSSDVDTSLHL